MWKLLEGVIDLVMENKARKFGSKTSRRFFVAPNFIFDDCRMLSNNAKLIFFNLCRRSCGTGRCYPSQQTIGRDCGIKSLVTVRKAISELVDAGLIRIESNKRRVNTYIQTERVWGTCPKSTQQRKDQHGQNLSIYRLNIDSDNEQKLSTKEYKKKENKYKERESILNQPLREEPEPSLETEYLQNNSNESKESINQLNCNSTDHHSYKRPLRDLINRKDDVSDVKMAREFAKLRQKWGLNSSNDDADL